jgi:phage terminase large subunit-like protein
MLPSSRYDSAKGDHAVAFINQLCHTKSDWAGKPFILLDWQEKIVRDVFGIVDRDDDTRQFRKVFVEIPKKQGKSELAAAVALYLLCADQEFGAEIYGCANDKKQAGIVFNVARDMVLLNPTLRRLCDINNSQKIIIYKPTRSTYSAVSSVVENKFGINVHGVVFDELLGQSSRSLFDTMTRGAGAARKQPLNFVITTAGYDRNSICWEVHNKALDILDGRKINATFYPVVYSAPTDADWSDEEVWKKYNPSLGVTVPLKNMTLEYEEAREDPALELKFRRDFLCQWTNAEIRWIPMDKYDKCADKFDIEKLAGRECYGGLDLASSDDIAAFVLIFPPNDNDSNYYILPHFWIPAENMFRRVKIHHVPYDRWVRDGFLTATDGNIIHYDFIEKEIERLYDIYDIKQIAFDDWGATQMAQNLDKMDIPMVKTRQGFYGLSRPSKELYRLILDEKFRHGGNPVLRWMVENVHIETDAAANVKPSKKKSKDKIDGVVAAVMALDLAIVQGDKKKNNAGITVYDPTTDTIIRNGKVVEEPDRKVETDAEMLRRLERESWRDM